MPLFSVAHLLPNKVLFELWSTPSQPQQMIFFWISVLCQFLRSWGGNPFSVWITMIYNDNKCFKFLSMSEEIRVCNPAIFPTSGVFRLESGPEETKTWADPEAEAAEGEEKEAEAETDTERDSRGRKEETERGVWISATKVAISTVRESEVQQTRKIRVEEFQIQIMPMEICRVSPWEEQCTVWGQVQPISNQVWKLKHRVKILLLFLWTKVKFWRRWQSQATHNRVIIEHICFWRLINVHSTQIFHS